MEQITDRQALAMLQLARPTWFDGEPVDFGKDNRFYLQNFSVARDEAVLFNLRDDARGREIRPGQYTQLVRRGYKHEILMSDTPAELRDHIEAVKRAKGHVLITGLGLGIIVRAVAQNPNVERITVIEYEDAIIKKVGPHVGEHAHDPDLIIDLVCADALTWEPPKAVHYGAVWHDIWACIDDRNLADFRRLRQRYENKTDWLGFWAESYCLWMKAQCEEAKLEVVALGLDADPEEILPSDYPAPSGQR